MRGSGRLRRQRLWPPLTLTLSPCRKRHGEREYPRPPRPLLLLPQPEPAEVVALIPDGPPRQFRWRGVMHQVAEAQGPERITPEWWRRTAEDDARLLRRRGHGRPPLLALPRRPLRPRRRHPAMVRAWGVRMMRHRSTRSSPSPLRGRAGMRVVHECQWNAPTANRSPACGERESRHARAGGWHAMTAFAELVAATNFSFLRGASHAHEMVGQAAELGLAAIGVADRNTLAGVVRAHHGRQGARHPPAGRRASRHHRRLRGGLLSDRPRRLWPPVPPADRRQPPRRQRPMPFHLRGDDRRERRPDPHRHPAAADSRRLSPSA